MRLADRLEEHPRRYLALFSVWYFLGELCLNARRPFWVDELFSLSLAGASSPGEIWRLMAEGWDLNPPLTYWIQWAVTRVAGEGEVVSRLPAICALWLMCLCLYEFVRRRSSARYGFIALLLPVLSYTGWEGTYARGYGLLLGASAAALLAWHFATEGIRRPLALAGLGLALALAVSSHYYAVYCIGALGGGELVRTWHRRRLDWAVWTALVSGLLPLVLYWPLIRHSSQLGSTFWIDAKFSYIQDSYIEVLGLAGGMLLVWAWCIVTDGPQLDAHPAPPPSKLPPHEAAACLMFLLMPVVLGLAAQMFTLGFYPRYVQPAVIGSAVVLALLVARTAHWTPRLPGLALGLLVGVGFVPWGLVQMLKAAALPPPAELAVGRFRRHLESPLPVVMDNNGRFAALHHYASPAQRAHLFALTDIAGSVRYLGSDTLLRAFETMNMVRPLPVQPYRLFVTAHPEFRVVLTTAESWLIQQLKADGARIELESYEKDRGLFAEELFVFHVTVQQPDVNAGAVATPGPLQSPRPR